MGDWQHWGVQIHPEKSFSLGFARVLSPYQKEKEGE